MVPLLKDLERACEGLAHGNFVRLILAALSDI